MINTEKSRKSVLCKSIILLSFLCLIIGGLVIYSSAASYSLTYDLGYVNAMIEQCSVSATYIDLPNAGNYPLTGSAGFARMSTQTINNIDFARSYVSISGSTQHENADITFTFSLPFTQGLRSLSFYFGYFDQNLGGSFPSPSASIVFADNTTANMTVSNFVSSSDYSIRKFDYSLTDSRQVKYIRVRTNSINSTSGSFIQRLYMSEIATTFDSDPTVDILNLLINTLGKDSSATDVQINNLTIDIDTLLRSLGQDRDRFLEYFVFPQVAPSDTIFPYISGLISNNSFILGLLSALFALSLVSALIFLL